MFLRYMYDLYSVLDNQKALKTLSRKLHSKLKKLMDFSRLFEPSINYTKKISKY